MAGPTPGGRLVGTWEELRLRYADSYSRGACLIALFRAKHPGRERLLGQEWTRCDYFPPSMLRVVRALPRPALAAMTKRERVALAALPELVTVWRGCYENNMAGMSWSLDRAVAAKFTTLYRYYQEGKARLVLRGTIARDRIAFYKAERKESEIVCDPADVDFVVESRDATPFTFSGGSR